MIRLTASLSLDLDNKWSYMKTHGNHEWQSFPSYLPAIVPRILEFLGSRGVKITFFVVGKDAELDQSGVLREIAIAGHEIGNHSYMHDPWLHLYSRQELTEDFERSEQAIEQATGIRTCAFRGPGFSLSSETLGVLASRNYRFDATVFPNLLNPLARAYFFHKSNLSREEKEQRKALFGTWKDALRPVKPFVWDLGGAELLEIPVTTMPLFKVPIHLSYIIYLAQYSRSLAMIDFRTALALCRLTRTEPSILLHPLDFMGPEDAPELAFFPAMNMARETKLTIVSDALAYLARHFDCTTMGEHSRRIEECGSVRHLRPTEMGH